MVFVGIHGLNEECRIFLARGVKTFLERYLYIGLQPLPPVLRAPDDVILQFVGAVVEGSCTHGTGLRYRSGIDSSPGSGVTMFKVYLSSTTLARGFL